MAKWGQKEKWYWGEKKRMMNGGFGGVVSPEDEGTKAEAPWEGVVEGS